MGIEFLLSNFQGTAVFIIVLSVLILVHEWGHFIVAKMVGVHVESFALGFGPKLFSKKHSGTDYRLNLVPLGGYVKLAGDIREECKGTSDEFFTKSVGHRSLIVLNGPMINFVLAYVCLFFVFMLGYPDLSTRVGSLIEKYPAIEAGIMENDKITHINKTKVETWTDLQKAISGSTGDDVEVGLIRDNQPMIKTISLRSQEVENVFGQKKKIRLIGITPYDEIITLKYSPGESFVKAYEKLVEIITLTYKSLYFMITGSMSAKEHLTGPVLKMKLSMLMDNNIRFNFIGNPDGLPKKLHETIEEVKGITGQNSGMILSMAFNYGSRLEIVEGIKKISKDVVAGRIKVSDIDEQMISDSLYTKGLPDPDLLIRTSGEMRISNFLLWQLSYAEMYFTDIYWPEFNAKEFNKAIENFQSRERRFGDVKALRK